MKSEKGITLIALAIMIIILVLLASVTVITGIDTLNEIKIKGFYSQLEVVQKKVDDMYITNETYIDENGNEINIFEAGSELTLTQRTILSEAISREGGNVLDDDIGIDNFRYFTKDDIKNILDIPDIDYNLFINFYNRVIIAEEGIQIKDETYQMLESTTYFIDGSEDKNIGNVDFEVKASKLGKSKYKIIIEPSKNVGDLQGTGTIQYKDVGTKYWEKSNKLEIIVEEKLPKYFDIKYQDINNNITNPPKSYGIYLDDKGDVKVTEVAKIYTAVGLLSITTDGIETIDEDKVKTYLLMNDITFTPADKNIDYWKPIGDVVAEEGLPKLPKEGRFDGNNKEIHVNYSDDGNYTVVYNKSNNYREIEYEFNILPIIREEEKIAEEANITINKNGETTQKTGQQTVKVKRVVDDIVVNATMDSISYKEIETVDIKVKNPEKINFIKNESKENAYYVILLIDYNYKTFTINAIPKDAIVIINNKTIPADGSGVFKNDKIIAGRDFSWKVSKDGCITQSSSSAERIETDITKDITLNVKFTINPAPSSATVLIKDGAGNTLKNAIGTQTLEIPCGTKITWSVSKSGCITQSSSSAETIETETKKDIALKVKFTINPSPSSATVLIKDGSGNTLKNATGSQTLELPYGTKITWSVSKSGCITQSSSSAETIETETKKDIALKVKFTITPTPSSATVLIKDGSGNTLKNATGSQTLELPYGTKVTWSVSKSGCITQSSSSAETIETETKKDIALKVKFIINPTPRSATVLIKDGSGNTLKNATGSQTLEIPYGTKVTWSVSKSGCITQSSSSAETIETETKKDIALKVKFIINPTPSSATVLIKDGSGNTLKNATGSQTLELPYGTKVTWSVSKSGYVTQSSSSAETITTETKKDIVLKITYKVIAKSPTDATVIIKNSSGTTIASGTGSATINLPAGTTGTWEVRKNYYNTQTGSYTVGTTANPVEITLTEKGWTTLIFNPISYEFTVDGNTSSWSERRSWLGTRFINSN